jgi:hypothetical protein
MELDGVLVLVVEGRVHLIDLHLVQVRVEVQQVDFVVNG